MLTLNPFLDSIAAVEEIVPIVGMVMVFGLPIIAVLTHHQRKMAELVRGQHTIPEHNVQRQLEVMQAQINDLRGMIQEHIIKNDQTVSLPQTPPPAPVQPTLEQRLNG